MIDNFDGQYKFLSNFHLSQIYYEGNAYPTVEHAYQAGKSTEHFFRKLIASLPASKAGLAKRRGRDIKLRPDWKSLQIDLMHELLCNKFKQEPFRTKLLETKDAIIIEGNYWHDNIWGDCLCGGDTCKKIEGQNWLGRLIMDIRSQLIEKGNCYRRHS